MEFLESVSGHCWVVEMLSHLKMLLPGQSLQDSGLALNIYLPIMPIIILWSSNHDGSMKRRI